MITERKTKEIQLILISDTAPGPIDIPDGTRLPVIDEVTTFKLFSTQKRTAVDQMGFHTGIVECLLVN